MTHSAPTSGIVKLTSRAVVAAVDVATSPHTHDLLTSIFGLLRQLLEAIGTVVETVLAGLLQSLFGTGDAIRARGTNRAAAQPLVDPREMVQSRTSFRISGTECPVCGDQLAAEATVCNDCGTPHHHDCWLYNRGCGIYGCRGRAH